MKTILSSSALLLICGCSTSLSATELNAKVGESVDGLPFRLRDRLVVELYERTPEGYRLVAQKEETMADPSRTYVLHIDGQVFSNSKTEIGLLADSSLKGVDLTSDSQLDEALTSFGAGYKEAATANAELSKARRADELADKTAAESVTAKAEADLVSAYSKNLSLAEAINAVQIAEQQLLELPTTASSSARIAKEGEIRVLKLKANEAARKAAVEPPF